MLAAIDTIDLARVNGIIELFKQARSAGRHIFVCGNGGSASTASHFACDIVKGASFNRAERFRIMALTDQLPTLTAYANDVSYDAVFVEQLRNFAERTALNSPLQGTAADVIKLAMINIDRRLAEEKLEAKMILQVHDELLFEAPAKEHTKLEKLVREEMEGVYKLAVPLVVEVGVGPNWRDLD